MQNLLLLNGYCCQIWWPKHTNLQLHTNRVMMHIQAGNHKHRALYACNCCCLCTCMQISTIWCHNLCVCVRMCVCTGSPAKRSAINYIYKRFNYNLWLFCLMVQPTTAVNCKYHHFHRYKGSLENRSLSNIRNVEISALMFEIILLLIDWW